MSERHPPIRPIRGRSSTLHADDPESSSTTEPLLGRTVRLFTGTGRSAPDPSRPVCACGVAHATGPTLGRMDDPLGCNSSRST